MTSAKPYDEYKDSGIEWVGPIPVEWSTLPLFAVVQANTASNKAGVESNLLSLSYGRIVRKDIAANDGLLPTSFDTYQVINRNDIVLRLTDLQNDKRSLRSAISLERGIITSAYLAVTPTKVLPDFLNYLLRAYDLQKVFYAMGGGLRQSINFSDLKWLPLVIPPAPVQESISAYLDRETAQIDDLIGKQERLIELLAEKRQAIITHAVTKGLNSNAPTKPSGIPGLGDVPASWTVSTIKREWTVIDCKHITAEFVENGFPLASIREVQGKYVNLSTAKFTTMEFYESMIEGKRLPEAGDLIFSRNATVGEVAIVPRTHRPFAMGQDVCLLKRQTHQTSAEFGWYAIRSHYVQQQISMAMIGSTFKRINVEDIRSISYCVPPPAEQRAIATYLEERSEAIDKAVVAAESIIELLNERRSALISAAVTGKIDVREGVA